MKKKETTIEDLAVITRKGFEGADKKFDILRGEIDERFDKVEERLDRIENILIRAHENRIERLEDRIRVVETALGK